MYEECNMKAWWEDALRHVKDIIASVLKVVLLPLCRYRDLMSLYRLNSVSVILQLGPERLLEMQMSLTYTELKDDK
jgi:hypothetical protein